MTDMVASTSSATTTTRPQRLALRWITAYQRAFEGRPSPCRFHPTCSQYVHDAIELHGTVRGGWFGVRRMVRCRPFGPSGFDPVPEVPHSSCRPDQRTPDVQRDT